MKKLVISLVASCSVVGAGLIGGSLLYNKNENFHNFVNKRFKKNEIQVASAESLNELQIKYIALQTKYESLLNEQSSSFAPGEDYEQELASLRLQIVELQTRLSTYEGVDIEPGDDDPQPIIKRLNLILPTNLYQTSNLYIIQLSSDKFLFSGDTNYAYIYSIADDEFSLIQNISRANNIDGSQKLGTDYTLVYSTLNDSSKFKGCLLFDKNGNLIDVHAESYAWNKSYKSNSNYLIYSDSSSNNKGILLVSENSINTTDIQNGYNFCFNEIPSGILVNPSYYSTSVGMYLYNPDLKTFDLKFQESFDSSIIQVECGYLLFSRSGSYGILFYDNDTNTVSKLYDSGYFFDSVIKVGSNYLLSSNQNYYFNGVLLFDNETKTISKILDNVYYFNRFIEVQDGYLISASSSSCSGIYYYNLPDKSLSKVYDSLYSLSSLYETEYGTFFRASGSNNVFYFDYTTKQVEVSLTSSSSSSYTPTFLKIKNYPTLLLVTFSSSSYVYDLETKTYHSFGANTVNNFEVFESGNGIVFSKYRGNSVYDFLVLNKQTLEFNTYFSSSCFFMQDENIFYCTSTGLNVCNCETLENTLLIAGLENCYFNLYNDNLFVSYKVSASSIASTKAGLWVYNKADNSVVRLSLVGGNYSVFTDLDDGVLISSSYPNINNVYYFDGVNLQSLNCGTYNFDSCYKVEGGYIICGSSRSYYFDSTTKTIGQPVTYRISSIVKMGNHYLVSSVSNGAGIYMFNTSSKAFTKISNYGYSINSIKYEEALKGYLLSSSSHEFVYLYYYDESDFIWKFRTYGYGLDIEI